MTEAAKFRPSREVPFSAQITGEPPAASTGLKKRLEIVDLWDADGIDRGMADVIDALPGLMIESALGRLYQHAPAEFDIDGELALAPAAVGAIMMPEESIATEEQLLGEVSAGDRRDEIDEAREHAALTQDIEFNPELLLDASDATND